jgi:hypothetical protein
MREFRRVGSTLTAVVPGLPIFNLSVLTGWRSPQATGGFEQIMPAQAAAFPYAYAY